MTPFDHFYILYTGLIIGIICFVFPFILSVFIIFDNKRENEILALNDQANDSINRIKEIIRDDNVEPKDKIAQIHNSSKQLKLKEWSKLIIQFLYNPQFLLWLIFIPLLITLFLCLADIFTGHQYYLTYYSFISFAISLYFLVGIFKKSIKLLKESNTK